eukprot:TRINITY_DN3168_c0_g1_i1.p1 TRINITY_DN3168_c0_g1~~TRINITY_DN3168_c0_g1_i1.p1  ORF type:complete len:397 (+),score=64.59 TRINITY_DN3168_c0_g1_i1:53-1192(+)
MTSVTVVSPINIAFIKYWGKVDEELIIPCNDSFSITLSTSNFRTKTTVTVSDDYDCDRLWLNGKEVEMEEGGRLKNVLQCARESCAASGKVYVVSENNFPTAAGMASSAAGLSALAYALATIWSPLTLDTSCLARIGSGSACRSIYGGFVKWLSGTPTEPNTSKASQFVPHTHWPEMQILCLVTKSNMKSISSTKGMLLSYQNSPLMKERIAKRVPERMQLVSEAVKMKDFETFASVTMADCEDFRSVCRSTTPTIDYWNERTEVIISLVKAFNNHAGRLRVAYTYDAGANAFIFCEKETLGELFAFFLHYFPTDPSKLHLEDNTLLSDMKPVPSELQNVIPGHKPTSLDLILHSTVGSGPSIIEDSSESLAQASGLPK